MWGKFVLHCVPGINVVCISASLHKHTYCPVKLKIKVTGFSKTFMCAHIHTTYRSQTGTQYVCVCACMCVFCASTGFILCLFNSQLTDSICASACVSLWVRLYCTPLCVCSSSFCLSDSSPASKLPAGLPSSRQSARHNAAFKLNKSPSGDNSRVRPNLCSSLQPAGLRWATQNMCVCVWMCVCVQGSVRPLDQEIVGEVWVKEGKP